MKKKNIILLTILLCVLLAVSFFLELDDLTEDRDIPCFSEMEYIRPDIESFKQNINAAEDAVTNGRSLRKAKECLAVCIEEYYNFDTMSTIADIRSDLDMTDAFYRDESAWCTEQLYVAKQLLEELYYTCAGSRFASKLERDYFWEGFCEDYADDSESYFSDDSVALMQKESNLVAEYYTLSTDPIIRMDGDEVHLNDYLTYPGSFEYNRAMGLFYEQYNSRFADIFIELIKTRRELARVQGYDSYEEMAYEVNFDRDYTPQQAEEYIEAIKTYIVPVYKSVMADNPYQYVDYYDVTPEENEEIVESAVRKMGGDIEEAFDFMRGHELYDISLSRNKASLSYQVYLSAYDAPYLFTCPEGDVEDILGFAHEFGHYTDAYINYDSYENIDLAECFSQGMEFLSICCLDDMLDEGELGNLTLIKMLDVMELYVQQGSFAEFEHILYSAPDEELTPEFINNLSLRLAEEYGYYDGYSRDYYAYSWVDIVHFFEQPFYVISYPVSNDVAMQIFALELEEKGSGLEKYTEMINRDTGYILEAVETAGLESPFAPGSMKKIAETIVTLIGS